MDKWKTGLVILLAIAVLAGCGKSQPQSKSDTESLFKATGMESISLTGQDILDGKQDDMSVKISDDINIDFHMERDNPNGTKLYAIYKDQAFNLAENYINPDVFDDGEAIPSFTYQMCCYDFDKDGVKEVVVACGNHSDQLSIFIFGLNLDSEFLFTPLNTLLGYTDAEVNEKGEICVSYENGVKTYQYNIKAEDAEYAKLSGSIKITAGIITAEQQKQYQNAITFVVDKEAPGLLILPHEALKNVAVYRIEYNAETDKYDLKEVICNADTISPDKPLVLQAYMPDLPSYGILYTDESGMEQLCGIGESQKDGSIYLFEMGVAKG